MANNWKAISGVPAGLSPETMLLLSDGSVLVHNAYGAEWWRLRPDGAGKYDTGSWSGPFKMAHARQFFASGVVKDGRVFVIGGEYLDGSSTPVDSPLAEIFDPLTEKWSTLTKPSAYDQINGDASACILADGRVLCGSLSTSLTATWDPVLDTWTTAGTGFGTKAQTRIGGCDEETWTLLPDGTVLTVGIAAPESAQKYDPVSDTWVPADTSPATLTEQLALLSLPDPTVNPPATVNIGEIGPAVLLPDGQLFAIGATGHTALYTPPATPDQPGSWSAGSDLPLDTSGNNFNSANGNLQTAIDAPCVLLSGGKVLLVAGNTVREVSSSGRVSFWSNPSNVYVYDPATNATPVALSKQPANNTTDTWQTRFLLLPTGQVLFTSQEAGKLSLLTPDASLTAYDASWRPTITSCPSTMALGHHYKLEGTQVNGLSQACSYGDDAQMATNFPIVRLTDTSSGAVAYVRSFDFSTLGVATGAAVQSTLIDIPTTLPTGDYDLRVIANGIPSDPVAVKIVPQAPQIVVDPEDALDFGTVCGGGPAYLTLTVYNVGGADLIVDRVANIAGSADFTVLANPATPLTIAAGDEVAFTLEFTPSSAGPESATVRITSNDPVTPNLDLVTTGTGGAGALELALADGGDFGDVCLGSFVDRPLVLVNDGACSLHVTNISASPDFLAPTVNSYPLTIGAGDAIELPIRFKPTALGVRSATITVTSDDPAGPKTVSLTGTAPASRLALVLADTGNFGKVCRGHFADEPLTLVNSGQCPLSVTAITSSSTAFLVPIVTKYPLVIQSHGSLSLPIRFQPTHHGPVSTTITVDSDDPAGPQRVSVSGDAPSGKLAVCGSAYFGEVDCGFAEKTINVCNIGECALQVAGVEFKRPRRHFKLVDNPFPATLPVGACLSVVIRYTASCEPECCELVIRSDDPEEPVRCLDVVAYTRCRCDKERCCGHPERCGCGCADGGHE